MVRTIHCCYIPVEKMLYLPGELGAVPLADESEVGAGLAGPGAGLALSVTLEEVAETLGGALLEMVKYCIYTVL